MTKERMVGGGMFRIINEYTIPKEKYSCLLQLRNNEEQGLRNDLLFMFSFFCSVLYLFELLGLLYPAPLDLLVVQSVDYTMSLAQKC